MKTYSRFIAMLMVGAIMGVSILGCNTFRGAGKDIQRGGEAIENTAEDVQNN